MKIISKYKDYYDYLSGIWGEDPLITYVRKRDKTPFWIQSEFCKVKIYIGGMLVEGLLYKGMFYYGDSLIPFSKTPPAYLTIGENLNGKYYYLGSLESEYGTQQLRLQDLFMIDFKTLTVDNNLRPSRDMFIQKAPIVDVHNINEKENCPVVLEMNREMYKNPNLKELGLNSFLSPEQTYRLISDWLSLQRTKAEDRPDTRTNVQKVESHGFDNKTSFRPNIKE